MYSEEDNSELLRRGYSHDKRLDLAQVILCVVVDRRGWPVAWEVLPGNTADREAMKKFLEKLRERFAVRRVSVVGDRGMISADIISQLEQAGEQPYEYILSCRMRNQREVNEEVLSRAGRYHEVAPNLEVKEVTVGNNRYIVCRNRYEAIHDAHSRAKMVAKLKGELSSGRGKSLLKNKGYARYLQLNKEAVSISDEALEREARLDSSLCYVRTAKCQQPRWHRHTRICGEWRGPSR